MDAIIKNNTQTKMCRQCHRTKSLSHFVNKSNTGICIICKSCRENQMRRYYEKKMMMKKESEKIAQSKRVTRQTSVQANVNCSFTVNEHPSSYMLNSCVPCVCQQDSNNYPGCSLSVIVPSSQWVPMSRLYGLNSSYNESFQAKLVYHLSFSNCDNTSLSSTELSS